MESVIKWRTGLPNKVGWYVVTVKSKQGELYVDTDYYKRDVGVKHYWFEFGDSSEEGIIAWCPVDEIEPYKG